MNSQIANDILNSINTATIFICVYVFCLIMLLLMAINSRTLKKEIITSYFILFFAFISGSVLYLIGYIEINNNLFIAVFRTLLSAGSMFLLNDNFSDISGTEIAQLTWFLFLFWLTHIIAASWTVYAFISLFGRKIIENIIVFFNKRKKTYVICGANKKSLCLASSLMINKNRLVIILDTDVNESNTQCIHDLGAILIKKRLFDHGKINEKILKRIGLMSRFKKKKVKLFLFEDDETYNINIAKAIIRTAEKNRVFTQNLRIFLQANDKIILRDIDQILENNMKYDINIFNEADLASRMLFQEYPIFDRLILDTETASVKDNNFTIMIIGFGKIGREVLFKSINNGQFIKYVENKPVSLPFNAIIVDPEFDKKSWQFETTHPYIKKEYPGINFESYSVESNEFFLLLEKKIEEINYFVIAMGNDQHNLKTAKIIQTYMENKNMNCSKKIIAVHMRNQANLFNEPSETSLFRMIKFFGEYESIFSEDILIHESMDELAYKINSQYNSMRKTEASKMSIVDNWNELGFFKKNSNRGVAEHLNTKLALIGYEIAPSSKSEFSGKKKLDEYINSVQLLNLLRIEHMRWCAFHYINGWTNYTTDEIKQLKKQNSCNQIDYDRRQNKNIRKHACLVPWEELTELSINFCYKTDLTRLIRAKYSNIIDFQLEDLNQILTIPLLLDYSGKKVVRINDSKMQTNQQTL